MTANAQDREAQERVQRVAEAVRLSTILGRGDALGLVRQVVSALDLDRLLADTEKRGRLAALQDVAKNLQSKPGDAWHSAWLNARTSR